MLLLILLGGDVGEWRESGGKMQGGTGRCPAARCHLHVVVESVVHDIEVAHLVLAVRPVREGGTQGDSGHSSACARASPYAYSVVVDTPGSLKTSRKLSRQHNT